MTDITNSLPDSTASIVKVEANRRNARLSTGPTSAEGKAIVARNAVRHGLRSTDPVVDGLETQEEWLDHLEGTINSLAPNGHLETVLAERVALLLWRLGRVTRYERAMSIVGHAQAELTWSAQRAGVARWDPDRRTPIADAAQAVTAAQAIIEWLEVSLTSAAPERKLETKAAVRVVEAAAGLAGVELFDTDDQDRQTCIIPGFPPDMELVEVQWSTTEVAIAIRAIAKKAEQPIEALWTQILDQAKKKLTDSNARHVQLKAEFDRYRRSRVLPADVGVLERVSRYEAGLERSLYKAMHELQRLQQARLAGNPVIPPPIVEIELTGVPGAEP